MSKFNDASRPQQLSYKIKVGCKLLKFGKRRLLTTLDSVESSSGGCIIIASTPTLFVVFYLMLSRVALHL